MKKIAVFYPRPDDGTSFYRGAGVLSYLKDVEFKPVGFDVKWSDLVGCDMLFIQRPHTKLALEMIDVAKQVNIPVWCDIDDMTWEVKTDSDRYFSFKDCTIDLMATIVKNSTITTVATQYLKDSLDVYGNVAVIPNAFNDYMFEFTPSIKREPSVTWRGSSTHMLDIAYFKDEINSTLKEARFVGINPELLLSIGIELVPSMELMQYFMYLKHQDNNNICMIPLKPTKFNFAKSNIGWIEATLSNKVALAPVWKEWQKPGVINYKDNEEFKSLLEHLLRGDIDIEAEIKDSKEFIKENLVLSKVNKLRQKIVEELC